MSTGRRLRAGRAVRVFAAVALGTMAGALPVLSSAPALAAAQCPAATTAVRVSAPGGGRTVALTFDDGPGRSTARILSVLMSAGVRATFFNLGSRTAAVPSLVRAESVQGHTLGNHTWTTST